MKNLKALIAASFLILLVSCSVPDAGGTIKMMDRYWQFYRNEQYDSLEQFYMEGRISEEQLTLLYGEMREMREKYGNFTRVNNGEIGVKKSLGPDQINLTYQVEHEKKPVEHKFTFEQWKGNEFRIVDHTFILQTKAF